MSIQELLKQSGIDFRRKDALKISNLIIKKAKEKGVRWVKKEELVEVNDYPQGFAPEMQDILIQYFSSKSQKNEKI